MDFLKDLFGTPKGPQVLPGATAQPGRGSDIAQLLARTLGAAGAGVGAATGSPQAAPAWLDKANTARAPATGASPFNRQDTIKGLLSRIFGVTNPISPAQPRSNILPGIGQGPTSGTGGLY